MHSLDLLIANETRDRRCRYCKGPLHHATYKRKASITRVKLPEEYSNRYSLCCGNPECRKRTLPPSCLFMGRRVSFQCVILVSLTLWQSGQKSAQTLSDLIDVDVRTIRRWAAYFREEFPRSFIWQKLRGHVPAEVRDDRLPGSLMMAFID